MRDTYENIVIGNFLYGLGLAMGRRPNRVAGCINLLQQTPLDRPLGDVLVHYPGTLRLLEFKRARAKLSKERAKLRVLEMALADFPELVEVSRWTHWFIRSESASAPALDVGVRPYLDFESDSAQEISMQTFTEAIVADAFGATRFPIEALNDYLHAVATFAGARDLEASGVLVTVDGSGILRYATVENFMDLRATAQMLLDHSFLHDVTRQNIRRQDDRRIAIEAEVPKPVRAQAVKQVLRLTR